MFFAAYIVFAYFILFLLLYEITNINNIMKGRNKEVYSSITSLNLRNL